MRALKNIKLKKGDIVYFDGDYTRAIDNWVDEYCTYGDLLDKRFFYTKIVKSERPIKYETIYKEPTPILDKEEKEYLEAVLRPFRNKINYVEKMMSNIDNEFLFICFSDTCWNLPRFKMGTMYKGMVAGKRYTLEELGLFEGENK